MSKKYLSFEKANTIAAGFVPLGDNLFEIMESLRDGGFTAFLPGYKFDCFFCEGERDLEIHKRCLVEIAKSQLGRPYPFIVDREDSSGLFRSAFMDKLRRDLEAENGVPVQELAERFPSEIWRYEIDPCKKKKAYIRMEDGQSYLKMEKELYRERKQALQDDISRHATSLADDFMFDREGRCHFLEKVLEEEAGALGFSRDTVRSCRSYPIFSKKMSGNWDLCWTIEEPDFFLWSPNEGTYRPRLELRCQGLDGFLGKERIGKSQNGKFLFIRYARMIPGFHFGYGKFEDLKELEVNIKAHFYLYRLVMSDIEDTIIDNLKS